MSLRKIGFFILSFVVVFFSCKKDDGIDDPVIEIRDRGEQQVTDKASLLEYLESHYYNSSDFDVSNTNPKIKDIIITALPSGETVPDGSTLLKDAVDTETTLFREVNYEFYILKLNQGGGEESPSFADNVSVAYEGFDLGNETFDSAVSPVAFDLVSLIPAWRKVLPKFNTAEGFTESGDGSVTFLNHGTGVMFVPSGLAYFASAPDGISAYESIAFKFELYGMSENDHDNDGIPSYKEDLNGDGEFTLQDPDDDSVTHDDTDGDNDPNAFDNDDDGDGILTIDEDTNGDGDPTNDIGANGIPKYLDSTERT